MIATEVGEGISKRVVSGELWVMRDTVCQLSTRDCFCLSRVSLRP